MKKIKVNQQTIEYRTSVLKDKVLIVIDDETYSFSHEELNKIPIYKYGRKSHVWNQGEYFESLELSLSSSEQLSSGSLNSPMPGKVFKLLKKQGDPVESGETIMILEAMKMEHPIKSPINGFVTELHFKEGEIVSGGVILANVESEL